MKVVKEQVGDTAILIQTMDDSLDVINESQDGPNIVDTSIDERVRDVYAKAKAIIRSVAEDIGGELASIRTDARPKGMEVSFNMGLSAEAGIWVLTARGDCALNVKMVWELGDDSGASSGTEGQSSGLR